MTGTNKAMFYALVLGVVAMPMLVMAEGEQQGQGTPANTKKSTGYTSDPGNPGGVPKADSASDLIMGIVKWLLGFVAALAVLMIVVAGIIYITSAGDEGRVDSAKRYLLYAIVGLIVAILAYAIVATIGNQFGAGTAGS